MIVDYNCHITVSKFKKYWAQDIYVLTPEFIGVSFSIVQISAHAKRLSVIQKHFFSLYLPASLGRNYFFVDAPIIALY